MTIDALIKGFLASEAATPTLTGADAAEAVREVLMANAMRKAVRGRRWIKRVGG